MEPPFLNLTHHTTYCPHVSLQEGRQAYPLESAVGSGPPCTPHPLEPGAHPPRPRVRPAGPAVWPRPSAEGAPLCPRIPSLPAPCFPSRALAGPLLSMMLLDTESLASSCEDEREGRGTRGWVSPSCSLQEATCHRSPSDSTEISSA